MAFDGGVDGLDIQRQAPATVGLLAHAGLAVEAVRSDDLDATVVVKHCVPISGKWACLAAGFASLSPKSAQVNNLRYVL